MEILQIENLSFKYPQAEKKALENVNLTIEEGSFNVICGESGCGKTTLLKMIKKEISPFGEKDGDIYFNKIKIENLTERQSASEIGFVFQNPDNQIVTDKVWHELAFGLENLGVENNVICRKVGEMASYFGIESWFRKNTDELSGGEKQLLNLASIMVMQPNLLILDEPTSQLDPIAASEFISTLQKMNKEFGLTIMLVEHRLEEVFPIADKIILMENGKILLYETPQKTANKLKEISKEHKMLLGMPSAIRIFNNLNINDKCPLTVKEGKSFLLKHFNNEKEKFFLPKQYFPNENVAVELKEAWFCYGKNSQDVLRGANLKIYNSEIFVILGGNGTGKTTALNIISGLLKTYKGKVKINGKKINTYKDNSLYDFLALLPQNPQTVFLKNTVNEDLEEILNLKSFSKNEKEKLKNEIINQFGISSLLFKHPYDLSGGEQQKAALAKILLNKPKILLMDEPTKGFDAYAKKVLGEILIKLKENGTAIIIVTHDIEFAAENADRCALFFDGQIISCDTPNKFFNDNNFYTTAANRISRHLYKNAITCEQVVYMCNKNGEKNE